MSIEDDIIFAHSSLVRKGVLSDISVELPARTPFLHVGHGKCVPILAVKHSGRDNSWFQVVTGYNSLQITTYVERASTPYYGT